MRGRSLYGTLMIGARTGVLLMSAMMLLLSIVVALLSLWMMSSTRDRIIVQVDACPVTQVAIVFGTSHRLRNGQPNPYYLGRMESAARWVHEGRIQQLLLSGDNRALSYNEPMVMWKGLRARGVPADVMTRDYAGFSTFDTLIRARKVFGIDKAVLITQVWHLPRALWIAEHIGLDAYGCSAPGELDDPGMLRREEWAQLRAIWDTLIWPRQPRFLGPSIALSQPDRPAEPAPTD